MMDLRTRIILKVGVPILLLIVVIIVLTVFSKRTVDQEPTTDGQTPTVTQDNGQTVTESQTTGLETLPSTPEPTFIAEEASPELFAKQTARIFVERFASFSNQNNNQHIDDVLSISTQKMIDWLATQRQDLSASSPFYGVTSRVIATTERSITDSKAVVEVRVQQNVTNNTEEEIVYRTGRVEMVRQGTQWLVDGFFWEEGE